MAFWAVGQLVVTPFVLFFANSPKQGLASDLALFARSFDFSMPCEPPLGEMPPSCMEMCHETVSFHYRDVTNHSNPTEPTVFCVTHAALRLGELSGTTASSTAVPQPMPELVFLNIKLDGSATHRDG